MSEQARVRYYRGRRLAWNSQQNLWWIKITDEWGDKVERCRNTFHGACEEIDADLARKSAKQ